MRKFIKLFALCLAAALTVAVSGCSARTSATADSFQKQAEKQGFKVSAETSQTDSVTKYLNAEKDNSDTKISFLTFSDASAAQGKYSDLKKTVSPSGGGSTVDSASYNKYTVTNGEIYYTLIRMDTTILYCQTTVTHKDEINNLIQALKY